MTDRPSNTVYELYTDLIAPTPYHLAALTGDLSLAITAFEQNIPFPDPFTTSQTPTAFSPFSPIDLALIHPCNYRLITLFALHGHKPLISESNASRKRRFQRQQQWVHLSILYRSMDSPQNIIQINTEAKEAVLKQNTTFSLLFPDTAPSIPSASFSTQQAPLRSQEEKQQHSEATDKLSEMNDHECCLTFSDQDEDNEADTDELVIDHELYQSFLTSFSAPTPQTLPIEQLPLPNRLLLLTATSMMTGIEDTNDKYLIKLLASSITLRCLKLLEDVADGTLDVTNGGDIEIVKEKVLDIYRFQDTITSHAPSLFQEWESMVDFNTISLLQQELPVVAQLVDCSFIDTTNDNDNDHDSININQSIKE